MGDILRTFALYLAYEEKHPDFVDTMLQRSVFSSNSIIEYLGGKSSGTRDQDTMQSFN